MPNYINADKRRARKAATRRGWAFASRKNTGITLIDREGMVIGTGLSPAAALAKCMRVALPRGRKKGTKVSEETLAKMSARERPDTALLNSSRPPEMRARTGRKISRALAGRKLSPQHIAASLAGRMRNGGYHVSDEVRQRLREVNTGRKHNPETIALLRRLGRERVLNNPQSIEALHRAGYAANLGRPLSPEHRAKLSAAMTGKKKTAEHIAKIRAALLGENLSADVKALIRQVAAAHNLNGVDDE